MTIRRRPPELGRYSRRQAIEFGRRGQRSRSPGGSANGALLIIVVVAVVLVGGAVLLPSAVAGFARGLAEQNPDWLRFPMVADAVRPELGDRLDRPAGTDPTPVEFQITSGSSASQITNQLVERGLVTDRLAFSWLLIVDGAGNRLQAGRHELNRTMSPRQVAEQLQRPPVATPPRITVSLRGGLRIEQITAYLIKEKETEIAFAPAEFHELATVPPADLVAAYTMLESKPAGASLEGFLGSGVFEIPPETSARDFVEILLDRRQAELGTLLDRTPPEPLTDFYQVVTLASIVEAEVQMPEEHPLVAGVYLNRLDPSLWPTRLLNADPTILYANDSARLRERPIEEWPNYVFWAPIGRPMAEVTLPDDLAGFQTYRVRGLPPGPIRSPSVGAIGGVLDPDTEDEYLYFVAKGDRFHAFARTWEDHLENVRKYVRGGG
ncbi:MAG: endolytic transglycosylase MltG [Chloroflexota bacterium]|nr:endolytic transglycosylase MltG [Chloroflexota bacterium]